MSVSELCVECKEPVRKLQHGITCLVCNRRQHRTCNTGVSRIDLFKARKNLIILDFRCPWCEANAYPNTPGNAILPEPHSARIDYDESFEVNDISDTKPDMEACIGSQTPTNKCYKFKPFPGTTYVMPSNTSIMVSDTMDSPKHGTVPESARVDYDESFDADTTHHMDTQTGSNDLETSADDVVFLGTTYVVPPNEPTFMDTDPMDNAFMIDDSSFDVRDVCPDLPPDQYNRSTTAGPLMTNAEPLLTSPVLKEKEVTFEVIEGGTMRNKKKLVSSDGYSYCVHKESKRSVSWRCSLRTRNHSCSAAVTQRGDKFIRGRYTHTHVSDPLVKKKTVLQRELRRDAMTDSHRPARRLVNAKLSQMSEDDRDLVRPLTEKLIRRVNRTRQKIRSQRPEIQKDTHKPASGVVQKIRSQRPETQKDTHKPASVVVQKIRSQRPETQKDTHKPASGVVNPNLKQAFDDDDDFVLSPSSGVFRKVKKASQKIRSQRPKTLRDVFDDDDDFVLSPSSGVFRKVNKVRQKTRSQPTQIPRDVFNDEDGFTLSPRSGLITKVKKAPQKMSQQPATQRKALTETQRPACGSVNPKVRYVFDSEEERKRMKRNLVRMVYRVRQKMRSQLLETQN